MMKLKDSHVWSACDALLVTLGFCTLLGCADRNFKAEKPAPQIACARLETKEEVEAAIHEAVAQRDAIILVDVAWAPTVEQQQRLAEFRQAFQAKYPHSKLAFRCLDCTPIDVDYAPLRALEGWKELEQVRGGGSLLHGMGELVWIRDGRVMLVRDPLAAPDAQALITQAEKLGMINH